MSSPETGDPTPKFLPRRRRALVLGCASILAFATLVTILAGNRIFAAILNVTADRASWAYVDGHLGGMRVARMTRSAGTVTIEFEYFVHEPEGMDSAIIVRRVWGRANPDRSIDVYVRTNMVDWDGQARGVEENLILENLPPGTYTLNYLDSDGSRHKLQIVEVP